MREIKKIVFRSSSLWASLELLQGPKKWVVIENQHFCGDNPMNSRQEFEEQTEALDNFQARFRRGIFFPMFQSWHPWK